MEEEIEEQVMRIRSKWRKKRKNNKKRKNEEEEKNKSYK